MKRRQPSLARAAATLLFAMPLVAHAAGLGLAANAKLEDLIRAYQKHEKIPGLSVAIVKASKIVFSKGFGFSDLENKVKATPDTMYRTASMGKVLTATAVMRSVERGQLSLDADIRTYCDFPQKVAPISTRDLLSHLSGIRHYGGPNDLAEQFSTVHYNTIADSTKPFRDDPLMFAPKTNYLYSSYGYVVAGLALEGAVHSSFLDWMHKDLFAPLGMTRTRDDDPSEIILNRASGYTFLNGALKIAPFIDMSNRMPAGGFLSTAPELATFAGALADGRLLKASSLREMMTPARLADGSTVNYGLGLSLWPDVSDPDKVLVVSHGGSSPGASGMLLIVPKEKLAVVIMTNLETAGGRFEEAMALAEIVLGRKLQ